MYHTLNNNNNNNFSTVDTRCAKVLLSTSDDSEVIIFPVINTTIFDRETNIILDSASDLSLCSKECAKRLHLRKHKIRCGFEITVLNSEKTVCVTEYVIIPLQGSSSLKCFVTPEITSDITHTTLPCDIERQISELNICPTQNFNNKPVTLHILVGLDQMSKVLINGYFRVLNSGIIILPTIYGSCLMGIKNNISAHYSYKVKRCLLINNNKLEYLLKRLFTHDRMHDIHTSNEYTEDELRSIELFNENFKIYQHDPINHITDYSTDYMRESKHILQNDLKKILKEKHDIETKYIMEVGLNRRQNPILPKNHFQTIRRAQILFKKLQQPDNANLKADYMTKITDMIEKCTISKVGSLNQILPELIETESTYLLPSNVLYNRTSTTTKTRVTIDGSKMGTFVQKGPSLLPKLFDLCLNFRSKPVILTCDIRRMYDSIGLQKSDRPFVRFLHKDLYSENAELEVLEFNSISMGLPDSVF